VKKIKAILCDFDGTLVDENGQYLPEVKTLIKKILDKNIRFSLATGRAYYSSIKKIENELNIQGIHILHGGSTEKMIQYFLTQKLAFSLEAIDHVYLSVIIRGDKHYADILNQPLSEYKNNEPILKMVLWAKANKLTEVEIDLHINNLQKSCSDIAAMKFNFVNFFGADITSEKATKHTAVLEYQRFLGLSDEDVVGIGDGPNDYPLFTACGFSIAMATAPKELKDIASLVVPSVKDGGMVEALKYIDGNLI